MSRGKVGQMRRGYDKVKMTFDTLWDAFLEVVEQPALVVDEGLVEELGAKIFHLTRDRIPEDFCDINFLITGFIEYLFKSDLPWEEEYHTAFHYYEDECRYTTPDIPSFVKCLNYMSRCVQVTKRFFKNLPKLVTVESIPATVGTEG
jgi:hypothetical protein